MVARVNTGVPFAGGALNAPGDERQSQNTFFTTADTGGISHVFSVDETPYYIKAFGLGDAALVAVLMVTNTNVGEVTEQLSLNGNPVGLIKFNNALVIDLPGVYRLQLVGGNNLVTVVGGPTNFSFWSWGLYGYATATDLGGLGPEQRAAFGLPPSS